MAASMLRRMPPKMSSSQAASKPALIQVGGPVPRSRCGDRSRWRRRVGPSPEAATPRAARAWRMRASASCRSRFDCDGPLDERGQRRVVEHRPPAGRGPVPPAVGGGGTGPTHSFGTGVCGGSKFGPTLQPASKNRQDRKPQPRDAEIRQLRRRRILLPVSFGNPKSEIRNKSKIQRPRPKRSRRTWSRFEFWIWVL